MEDRKLSSPVEAIEERQATASAVVFAGEACPFVGRYRVARLGGAPAR